MTESNPNPWTQAFTAFLPDTAEGNPWRKAMDQWWSAFNVGGAQQNMDVFDRIINQSRAFFELGERMCKGMADTEEALNITRLTENALEGMRKFFELSPEKGLDMGFWQLPLDNWQRTMSALSAGVPGDHLRAFTPSAAATETALAQVDKFLATPGVGYTREAQAQYQTLIKLALDYQAAYQRYLGGYLEMGRRSVERLQSRMAKRVKNNNAISSLRELYNEWVEASEEVYAEHVMTDNYVHNHGQLVNALMALKHQGSRMIDEMAGAYNLPTRGEMDTVHRRLQRTRRENHALSDQVAELNEQVRRLREAVDSANARIAASAAPKPARASGGNGSSKPVSRKSKTEG